MGMQRNPVLLAFLFRTALFLPPCLGLWYWQAEWFSAPAALASGWLMQQLFPVWVVAAEWSHRTLSVVTTLKLDMATGVKGGQFASMVAEVSPMIYGYGLPLFCAMFLASGAGRRWRRLLLGIVLLIPFQVWGICFDLLKQVAIGAGAGVAAQTGIDPWQREVIALGYQLGTLILPTVAPVGLWLALERQFIPMLMLEGALRRSDQNDKKGEMRDRV